MGKPMIFLNALGKAEVVFEKDAQGRQVIRGLPLMRPGTWNRRTYTEADLKGLVANFAIAKAQDNFEPPLWPYHSYDSEGKPVRADSRDIQGWFSDIAFDEQAQLLLGDLIAVEEGLVRDIQGGKTRHLSAEIDPAYHSPGAGKNLGPTIIGAAGVGYPSIRGMPPWEMVINAQEFGYEAEASPSAVSATATSPGPSGHPLPGGEGTAERHTAREAIHALAQTSNGAPMRDTLLPPQCFLIVGDRKNPSTWSLPYRDADTSSPMTDQWGRKQRYTKAGPISCGRIRAIAAALKGARGSTITASDLDAAAVGKLKTAASACKIASPVIEALEEKGGTHMPGILDRIRALVGTTPSEADIESLSAELEEALKPKAEPPRAKADPPKPTTLGQAGDDKDAMIAALTAKVEADNAKHDAAIVELQQQRHGEQVERLVDTLVAGGYVPPVARRRTLALYMALPPDQKVETLVQAADGTEQKAQVTMVELLTDILKDRGPKVSTQAQGLTHDRPDGLPGEKTAAELEAAGREAAEKRNPAKKGG